MEEEKKKGSGKGEGGSGSGDERRNKFRKVSERNREKGFNIFCLLGGGR